MAFSEEIKLQVKKKSDFRCVVCGEAFVEIHHITPQKENGSDTIENAVALCAHCHNIYGGNVRKREELIQIRDQYYERVEKEKQIRQDFFKMEKAEGRAKIPIKKEEILLHCIITEEEDFNKAAQKIYRLVYRTQKREPNAKRVLVVEIKGHRVPAGGYDRDMFELQGAFLLKNLLPYVQIMHLPLISVENPEPQKELENENLIICTDKEEVKEKIEEFGKEKLCVWDGNEEEEKNRND